VVPGLSIPTSLLGSLLAPQWLKWLAAPQDGPVLVLLGLVLLACGLGLWSRRRP
jgi:LPXTG-motif cell wall-anchored protein